MIHVSECIICGGSSLVILKKHRFISPKISGLPDTIETASYNDIRIQVLFRELLPNNDEAVFEVTLCNSCGIIFNNPRFTEDELKRKYAVLDGLHKERQSSTDGVVRRENRRGERILNTVRLLSDGDTQNKILDYGGADGSVMRPFVTAGYDCSLVDYMRYDLPGGIRYAGKDHNELSESQLYDLILFVHVLEHIPHPGEILSEVALHLQDKGLVYIEVPLGCWREWKVQKEPLTHINFFSEGSVFNLLCEVGLFPVYMKTKYQNVLENKIWCINTIAAKKPQDIKVNIYQTKTQIGRPFYYLFPFILDPAGSLLKVANKSIHHIRSLIK